MVDGLFAKDANIQWIAIAFDAGFASLIHAQLCNAFAAISFRDKAVKRRAEIAVFLWSVDFKQTTGFVQFVFNGVKGRNFDVSGNQFRKCRSGRNTMPGM